MRSATPTRLFARHALGAFAACAALLTSVSASAIEVGSAAPIPVAVGLPILPIGSAPSASLLSPGAPTPLSEPSRAGSRTTALPNYYVYAIQPVDEAHNALGPIPVGASVWFRVSIANGGGGYGVDHSIRVQLTVDGVPVDTGDIDLTSLNPGYYTDVYTDTPWTATAGTHAVRFTVDVLGEEPEADESDNSKTVTLTTGNAGGLADLVISGSIEPTDTSRNPVSGVVVGQTVLFRFQVANLGTGYPTSTSITISLTLDGAPIGGGTYNLTSLPPDFYVTFYSPAWTATAGTHVLVATVDVFNTQAELDESNNRRTDSFVVASACSMSCSASAPTSGIAGAPQSFVAFTAVSECPSTSVTYAWNFGDGTPDGASHSAFHTYAAAGTYDWTMTATSAQAGTCTETGRITISSSCFLPSITLEPRDVTIRPGEQTVLTVLASGAPLEYQWYVGESGDLARPIAYARSSWYTTEPLTLPATYWVRISNSCGLVDSRTVRVTVEGGGANCTGIPILLPAAAHAAGVGTSFWRTDLTIFNPGDTVVAVWLRFFPRDTDNVSSRCVAVGTIAANGTRSFDDVVLSVFGQGSASGGIGVYFDTGMPLVGSRTYTTEVGGDGTYGQSISGRSPMEGLAAGEAGTLVQLEESVDRRTNVGLLNTSSNLTVVEIRLSAADGVALGTRSVTLRAYEHHQIDRILRTVTSAEIRNARAEIRVLSGGPVLAYSSVVDNDTGDPSYSEPLE